MLRPTADAEIDTSAPLDAVVEKILGVVLREQSLLTQMGYKFS